jgi:hypothetical protein
MASRLPTPPADAPAGAINASENDVGNAAIKTTDGQGKEVRIHPGQGVNSNASEKDSGNAAIKTADGHGEKVKIHPDQGVNRTIVTFLLKEVEGFPRLHELREKVSRPLSTSAT